MKRRCETKLSGLAYAAACEHQTWGRALCYYHDKLAAGLCSLVHATLSAIERGTEGDRAQSPVYAAALKHARRPVEEARGRADLRDHRVALEAALLLAASGAPRTWTPKSRHTTSGASEQPKRSSAGRSGGRGLL